MKLILADSELNGTSEGEIREMKMLPCDGSVESEDGLVIVIYGTLEPIHGDYLTI